MLFRLSILCGVLIEIVSAPPPCRASSRPASQPVPHTETVTLALITAFVFFKDHMWKGIAGFLLLCSSHVRDFLWDAFVSNIGFALGVLKWSPTICVIMMFVVAFVSWLQFALTGVIRVGIIAVRVQ